ncbi:Peptidylprolyl isomerase [Hyella patelloides LEGE 07179]|uniref:peptidylprolyl isomerase n=1 Tax=Hyella patelloides LEGE 07179 TaxID=945734 RepID=A0A563VUM3_9CYAN|nr:peptidylprolyl isomerase [Hyella patelloides]VEP15089.1 Peptidylprolyl isomerase [Hyella patelloides LEGE 07179]
MSQASINSSKTITITERDILHQIKLSCKIPEIVEQIITRKVIAEVVEKADIKVTTEELQKAANQMRAMIKLQDAQATWAWLEKHGLSLDDFEEIVQITLLSQKLTTHLFADKVEPYFYEHQLDYAGAVIYEIVLDDEDEAIELFYEIQEGEISFFEAAQKYIPDMELRRKGGYQGEVDRSEMLPEVSAKVFTANAPTILKPIITSKGVHLILVEEIIKPELNNKLRQKIMLDLFSKWLKQQVEKIQVVSHIEANSKVVK